ncbi:hypothetical protein ACFE04_002480 [Oxalis oulophora]
MAANELVLANLVNKFDWKLPDGKTYEELDMSEATGLTKHREVPLFARATLSNTHLTTTSTSTNFSLFLLKPFVTGNSLMIMKRYGSSSVDRNNTMVETLKRNAVIRSQKVEDVMQTIDRALFVPHGTSPYVDTPLSIGYNATVSAPHMHATCLELLQQNLQPGMRALDVGSGTGYLTACFAVMVGPQGRAVGVEHIPELVDFSIKNIEKSAAAPLLKDGVLQINVGDGREGWPEYAPYDAIHVGAAAPEIPQPLIDQLKPGGRMVIPVGNIFQDLKVVDKNLDGSLSVRSETSVRYVPLTSKDAQIRGSELMDNFTENRNILEQYDILSNIIFRLDLDGMSNCALVAKVWRKVIVDKWFREEYIKTRGILVGNISGFFMRLRNPNPTMVIESQIKAPRLVSAKIWRTKRAKRVKGFPIKLPFKPFKRLKWILHRKTRKVPLSMAFLSPDSNNLDNGQRRFSKIVVDPGYFISSSKGIIAFSDTKMSRYFLWNPLGGRVYKIPKAIPDYKVFAIGFIVEEENDGSSLYCKLILAESTATEDIQACIGISSQRGALGIFIRLIALRGYHFLLGMWGN